MSDWRPPQARDHADTLPPQWFIYSFVKVMFELGGNVTVVLLGKYPPVTFTVYVPAASPVNVNV